jgi:hypothetical protein
MNITSPHRDVAGLASSNSPGSRCPEPESWLKAINQRLRMAFLLRKEHTLFLLVLQMTAHSIPQDQVVCSDSVLEKKGVYQN